MHRHAKLAQAATKGLGQRLQSQTHPENGEATLAALSMVSLVPKCWGEPGPGDITTRSGFTRSKTSSATGVRTVTTSAPVWRK